MLDRYGRNITYLRLSVTELCNLRCRYCMPPEGVCKKAHEQMLTEEEIVLAVETAAELGITKLRITGGEPLVKKNIVSICERTAAVPGIAEVCITTNGVLLPAMAGPLKEAGVRRLNISLDTLDREKYRYITRIGSLESALKGIAPEAVPPIFEKGYSTDDGRGLGLAICMATVQLHGGTLELAATSPTGTTFRFTVPKEDAR